MADPWDNNGSASFSTMTYTRSSGYNNRSRGQRNNYPQRWQNRSFNSDSGRNSNQGHGYDNSLQEQDGNSLVIYIDSEKVGKLIGKGGSKIRELQDESRSKINIDRSNTDTTTAVTIIGSEESQQQARKLIDELLNDNPYPPRNVSTQPEPQEERPQIDLDTFDWTLAGQQCKEYEKQRWVNFVPIIKNFYNEASEVTNFSKEHVAHIRLTNNNIEATHVFEAEKGTQEDLSIPNPIETFEQAFQDYPDILSEIRKQKFEKPSPIQCQAWPVLLSGRDLIGIAQTGTGKTLAFLLPALIHIDGQETPRAKRGGPNVLVMAPTRELALQIEKEVGKYSYHGIKAVCVYGGGSRKEQVNIVTKGVQIVIATPGRLNDLVQAKVLDVSSVTYLILDEADRMLDMGFEPQIRKILLDIRPDRQTVMTSATWPQGVRRLAQSYMENPIQVCVGSLDLAAVHSVTQKIYIISEQEKIDFLYQFFREMGPEDKAMVFAAKKAKVDDLASDLALNGVSCQSIHGGREQIDREQALEDLKTGEVRILLATDVASRGIDIEDISHVFNFDFPRDIEEYVHRVGRTGRAGRTGESITLMTRRDWSHAKKLINILEEASQEVPEELYSMSEKYDVWKERKAQEKELEKSDAHGFSDRRRYGGGGDHDRRNHWRGGW